MAPLPDGSYSGIVVDVSDAGGGAVSIDVAISAGPAKGDVVTVRTVAAGRDALDLLALPVTIEVTGGAPAVTFD